MTISISTNTEQQGDKEREQAEQEFLANNPALDRRIINGMLTDPESLFQELAVEGLSKNAVLRRAADCGISDSILRQIKRVALDLAGESVGTKLNRARVRARECLSCSRVFLSMGPGNRLCHRCRSNSAGLAAL